MTIVGTEAKPHSTIPCLERARIIRDAAAEHHRRAREPWREFIRRWQHHAARREWLAALRKGAYQ